MVQELAVLGVFEEVDWGFSFVEDVLVIILLYVINIIINVVRFGVFFEFLQVFLERVARF